MKTTRIPLLLAVVATLAIAAHAVCGSQPEGDAKDAVRKVLDDQVKAWNKGDLSGFMAGYWNSPELSFFSGGKKTRGWQATLDRYRKKYQGEGKEMGKLAFKDLKIDMLGTNHALVRGGWELTLTKGRAGGLFTVIFAKTSGDWRITHDHTSAE
jgi:beta-aspartyl-peptidase (threonine type)